MSTSTAANASFWHSLRDLLIQTNAESRAVDRGPLAVTACSGCMRGIRRMRPDDYSLRTSTGVLLRLTHTIIVLFVARSSGVR
jgi:hypothetical protein